MFRFCRSKCHKSFKAKRNPRRVRWTKAYRKSHGKELTVDPVYDFEKSRDTAVRYDRNLWVDTVQAMEKIAKIKEDREARFWDERMAGARHTKAEIIKKDLIKNQTLIGDVEMRKRVDKLREKRDEKREQKKLSKLSKRKEKNINIGLDQEMDVEEEGPSKNDLKKSIKKQKKNYRKVVLQRKIDRRLNKNKIIEEVDVE